MSSNAGLPMSRTFINHSVNTHAQSKDICKTMMFPQHRYKNTVRSQLSYTSRSLKFSHTVNTSGQAERTSFDSLETARSFLLYIPKSTTGYQAIIPSVYTQINDRMPIIHVHAHPLSDNWWWPRVTATKNGITNTWCQFTVRKLTQVPTAHWYPFCPNHRICIRLLGMYQAYQARDLSNVDTCNNVSASV